MGHGIYRKRDILVLIRLSVFRDHILEPRYYNPYLENTTTSLTYVISIPRLHDGTTCYLSSTSKPIVILVYIIYFSSLVI